MADQKKISMSVASVETILSKDQSLQAKAAQLKKLSKAKETELEAIKNERAELNSKLVNEIKQSDVFFAAKVITIAAQSPSGADNKTRQAMKRRRTRLIKTAVDCFPDYDIDTIKQDNHIIVKPVYVGCKFTREAKAIRATLNDFKSLGIKCTIPKIETLVGMLKSRDSKQSAVVPSQSGLAIKDIEKVMNEAQKAEELREKAHKARLARANAA